MEFLKNAALPQSLEHFRLIILVSGLNSLLLMTFIAFLLGSSALSYFYGRKGRSLGRKPLLILAMAIIDVAVYSKSAIAFLGLLPALSLLFVYAQILQSTGAISAGLAGAGFLSLLAALTLIYTYKYTFRVESVLGEMDGRPAGGETDDYRKGNMRVHLRSGRWGIFLLLLSLFLFGSASSVASDPAGWSNVRSALDLLLLPGIWVNFLKWISLSIGLTGSGLLFFLSAYRGGKSTLPEEAKGALGEVAVRFSAVSMLALPILVVANLLGLPADSISGTVYLLAGVAVSLLFLSAHFLYAYFRMRIARHAAAGLFLFLSASGALMINDQVTISNATREQALLLSLKYETGTGELKSQLGIAAAAMTGEEIYDAKCSACHTFDQKKVGPPYNETLPKYKNDKGKIISFVMNPVKIDPAYPPMPNQGLKPAEADSIVSYLLRKFGSGPK